MPAAVAGAWRATGGSFALRVDQGGTAETVTVTVTSGREYWLTADGRIDSSDGDGDLLTLVAAAIASHSLVSSCSITLVEGRVRITTDVAVSLLWTDGATTLDPTLLGFTDADTTAGTTTDAPSTCPYVWLPGAQLSFDSRDRQVLPRGRRESLSGLVYTASFGSSAKRREVSFELLFQSRMLEEYAGSDRTAWETFDGLVVSAGRRVRLYEDAGTVSSGTGFATYVAGAVPEVARNRRHTVRWDVELELRRSGLDTRSAAPTIWTPMSGGYVSVSPGNYVSLANPTNLNGLTGMTFAFWARASAGSGGDAEMLGRAGWAAVTQRGSGPYAMTWLPGDRTPTLTQLTDGSWHHWCAVWDAGTVTWYLDGASAGSTVAAGTAPSTLPTVTAPLLIGGASGTAPAHSFDVARLSVWGAVATSTQVAQLFAERRDLASGAGLTLGQPLYWLALDDLVVEGSAGGTASAVGSPVFTAGA